MPYQPPNIWEPVAYTGSNTRFYKSESGINLHRRSIYTFLKRTAPAPFMVNFDAPNREQTCTLRERSNTPLQALQLMNDVQHVEAARAFAQRILTTVPDTHPDASGERLRFAWQAALARLPSPAESAAVLEFYRSRLTKFQSSPEEASQLILVGEAKPEAGLNPAELAAWTLTANLLLNLDETITRN